MARKPEVVCRSEGPGVRQTVVCEQTRFRKGCGGFPVRYKVTADLDYPYGGFDGEVHKRYRGAVAWTYVDVAAFARLWHGPAEAAREARDFFQAGRHLKADYDCGSAEDVRAVDEEVRRAKVAPRGPWGYVNWRKCGGEDRIHVAQVVAHPRGLPWYRVRLFGGAWDAEPLEMRRTATIRGRFPKGHTDPYKVGRQWAGKAWRYDPACDPRLAQAQFDGLQARRI